MKIKSDEKLNKELQAEVSTLRGMIVDNNKHHSTRFLAVSSEDRPSMIITDTETNKTIEVPLYAYSNVMKALTELFDE